MKQIKKILMCGLMSIVLLAHGLMMPASEVKAEVAIMYSGNCGDVAWSIDEIGNLHIYGSGAMLDYPYTDEYGTMYRRPDWTKHNYNSITIDEGVTNISNYAFENNQNITDVRIPKSVTIIGGYAFYNCSKLMDVYFEGDSCSIHEKSFVNSIDSVEERFMGTFYCSKNSNIFIFAKEHGIDYQIPETECLHKPGENLNGVVYCSLCGSFLCFAPEMNESTTTEKEGETTVEEITTKIETTTEVSTTKQDITSKASPTESETTIEKRTTTQQEATIEETKEQVTSKNDLQKQQVEESKNTITIEVKPKTSKIKKIKKAKKSLKITWKKVKKVNGYQLQYSISKRFKKAKKITIEKSKITSKTIKRLKGKKRYYIRIRTYILVKGKKYYSNWSKTKSEKTKSLK